MALFSYTKTTWIDRAVQFVRRYRDESNVQKTFTPDEGTIYAAGTPLNAVNLNKLEQGVADVTTEVITHEKDPWAHGLMANNKAIAELLMLADIDNKIFSPNLNKFYTNFTGVMDYSVGTIDAYNQTISGDVAAGTTVLTVATTDPLTVGKQISIQDGTNYEERTIISLTSTTLTVAALTNSYVSPKVYRSNITGTEFGAVNTTYNRTSTVAIAPLETKGNGARKLVYLSNGWLVCAVLNTGFNYISLYKSTDNGGTWSALCYTSSGVDSTSVPAIDSYGTNITIVYPTPNGGGSIYATTVDAATVANADQNGFKVLDASTLTNNAVSVAYDTAGNIHAAWCCRTGALPNSYNLRYAISTDAGVSWTATAISAVSSSGTDLTNPCIITKNNIPYILYQLNNAGTYSVKLITHAGTGIWGTYTTTDSKSTFVSNASSTYPQLNPSACVDSAGTIHVAWHTKDGTDPTYNNIWHNKSITDGSSWVGKTKLTTGNLYSQEYPSIATNAQNNIFVYFQGRDSGTVNQIRKVVYTNSWSSVSNVTAVVFQSAVTPSTCINYPNFSEPLCVYKDNDSALTKFKGVLTAVGGALKTTIRMNIFPNQGAKNISAYITKSKTSGFTVELTAHFGAPNDTEVYDTSLADSYSANLESGTIEERAYVGIDPSVGGTTICLKIVLVRSATTDTSSVLKLVGGVS